MEDSSLPDTIEQVDNQTCKARTRVTMQRLLHGLGTQVPGHVQVASPSSTVLPQSTHLLTPPPHLRKRLKFLAKGQASAQSTTGTVTLGANRKRKKNKVAWIVWFWHDLEKLGILEILRILTF